MPRKPRIEYAGAVYHVMSRGNRQEAIYRDNRDREIFLDTLEEACAKTGWVVHAFVLMGNHYHMLLETPCANLVAGMKWLQGTYTQRFNARHKLWGHLFQGRYKALPVDADSGEYFSTVSSYIHLNPARARLFSLDNEQLSDFPWSSYPLFLKPSARPVWLRVNRVLQSFGQTDSTAGRNAYQRLMQARVAEIAGSDSSLEADAQWENIRRGWCFGGESFRQDMLDKLDAIIGANSRRESFSGDEVRLHDEASAERLVCDGLTRLGVKDSDLPVLPKGVAEKKAVIALVKQRTHVSNRWIAERLCAGHPANIPRYLAEVRAAQPGDRIHQLIRMLKCED